MYRRRFPWKLAIGLVLVLFALAACGGAATQAPSEGPAAPPADSASDNDCNTHCDGAPALKRRRSSRGGASTLATPRDAPPPASPRREPASGAAALRAWRLTEARRNIYQPPMPPASLQERLAEADLSSAEVPLLALRLSQLQKEGAQKLAILAAQEELRLLRCKISLLRQV